MYGDVNTDWQAAGSDDNNFKSACAGFQRLSNGTESH